MSKGTQIGVGALAIAALIGWYGYTNLGAGATFQYFQTLDEFQASGGAAQGRALRVHGYVADGSIDRQLEQRQVRFEVQNDPPHAGARGQTLAVVYRGLETPDLFQDGAEVVVEGRLEGAVFVADNVLAKCPSKFQAQAEANASGAATSPASTGL